MVSLVSPTLAPTAAPRRAVSNEAARVLSELGQVSQTVADSFTEHYEEEARIQNELLFAEFQSSMTESLRTGAENAGRGYSKQFMSEFDKMRADAMEGAPQRGRDNLNLSLDKYRLSAEQQAKKVEASAIAKAKAKAKALAAKARQQALRSQGNALISNPDLLPEMMASDPKNADYYVGLAANARAMTDPVGVAQEFLEGKWDAYVSPSQKMTFMKQGAAAQARLEREAEADLRVRQSEYEAALAEDAAFAQANGFAPADSVYSPDVTKALYGDKSAEINQQYQAAIDFAETAHKVNTASIVDTQAEYEALVAEVQKPGNTETDVARVVHLEKAMEQRNAAIANDAASFVAGGNDEVSAAFQVYQQSEGDASAVAASRYKTALQAEYDRMGIPSQFQRLMPKTAAEQLVGQISEVGIDAAPQALAQLAQGIDDPRLMGELSSAGLSQEYVSAMRHSDNPGLSATIAGLAQTSEAELKTGVATVDVSDMNRELVDLLQEYRGAFEAGDPTGQAVRMFDREFSVATKLALSRVRQGVDPSVAASGVVDDMFPETVIFDNNARVVAPSGVQQNVIEYSLDRGRSEVALREFGPQPLDDPALPEFADLEVYINAAKRGVWLNNSTGDGAVLNIDLGGFYLPVRNGSGELYEMKFQDMTRPTYFERIRGRSKNQGALDVD